MNKTMPELYVDDANASLLRDAAGNPVPLCAVRVRGRLSETLASVEVEQHYRNPRNHNIEAVYTFPLPIGAMLLELAVDIDGRTLAGHVVERKAAEARYEDAITDGDTAVMVRDLGDGLYSMNLGNLLAGESAVIRYRYALTLAWQGDRLRFLLPTTIAPRYGDAGAAGLSPWETPESDIVVEYPLDLAIVVDGSLTECELGSPTHRVTMARIGDAFEVKLAESACLDRDFVLTATSRESMPSTLRIVRDGETCVAFASVRIPESDEAVRAPLCLKVVIDCSGSMSGAGIAQARKAALAILDQLRPEDHVGFTLFGDAPEHLFKTLVPCDAQTLEIARRRLAGLNADKGGTETAAALRAAYRLSGKPRVRFADWVSETCPGSRPAVLLITDGEIWDCEALIEEARQSGHRVFTVGVGTAVAAGFVRELAVATGGACELVAPQEGMAERVLVQFHRLRQPSVAPLELAWGTAPLWRTDLPATLFAGDTVNVFAGFDSSEPSCLRWTGGATGSAVAVPADLPDIPRLAARARIDAASDTAERLALALRYQLLTDETNFLVVAERDAKAEELPELVKVPQMQPAGTLAIRRSPMRDPSHQFNGGIFNMLSVSAMTEAGLPRTRGGVARSIGFVKDLMDAKIDFLRSHKAPERELVPADFLVRLAGDFAGERNPDALPSSFDDLSNRGLPAWIIAACRDSLADAADESDLVTFLLNALLQSAADVAIPRDFVRLVASARKRSGLAMKDGALLEARLAAHLADIDAQSWAWKPDATVGQLPG